MTSPERYCPRCAQSAGGACLTGGTVHLGAAPSTGAHEWARNAREAAVCPTRIAETAAAQTTDPDLWMFRDFLLAPVWHPWLHETIRRACDHPKAADWSTEQIEAEVVAHMRYIAIERYLACADKAAKAAQEKARQSAAVAAARKARGLKTTRKRP